jgi:tyrosyl-DNA phosphodiesterase-1
MKSAKAKQTPIIISDSEDDLPVIVKPKRVSKKRPRPIDSPTKDKETHSPPIDLSTPPDPTSTSTSTATNATTSTAPPANSFLSERAQLEKERLERQRRLREMGKLPPEDAPPPSKRQRSESVEQKTAANGIASTSKTTVPVIFGKSKLFGAQKTTAENRFWDGEIRQSGNLHVKPENETGPTFRLSEILGAVSSSMTFIINAETYHSLLQTDELQMAILSSYSTDVSWIYSMFPPRVPVILVQQPDESGNAKVKNILPNWVMTAPFMRGGRGAMHVKVGSPTK